MTPLAPLLAIAFIESFATILLERGVYFYAQDHLQFSPTANLGLALGIGVCYVIGALISHKLAHRLGEKRVLLTVLIIHCALHAALAFFAAVPPFLLLNFTLALVTGLKWPIVESYVSAGRTAGQTARAVGLFSISWALSVPPGMAAAGQLIHWKPASLFVAAALVNLVTLAIVCLLESRPTHLAHDSPHRPSAEEMSRLPRLLSSGRWSMFASYMLLFLIVPLMPEIFRSMGFGVRSSTALGSLVEVVRAVTFIAMVNTIAWHGRPSGLFFAAVALPIGFLMILFGAELPQQFAGQHLATVLLGELVFGVAAGFAYYAALYYAMVHANASVESGGAHESLVGLGFAVGPAVGLLGYLLAGPLGGHNTGMVVAVVPIILICAAGALHPLRALRLCSRGASSLQPCGLHGAKTGRRSQ
ncbi:MAG: MFS transporter [Planctomycetes bacterium]|nr:MFS transporter [Planctomycetota bacterium]